MDNDDPSLLPFEQKQNIFGNAGNFNPPKTNSDVPLQPSPQDPFDNFPSSDRDADYKISMTILTKLMGNIEKVNINIDSILNKVINIKTQTSAKITELESKHQQLNTDITSHQENFQNMLEQLNVSASDKQLIEDQLKQSEIDNKLKDDEINTLIISQKQLQNDIIKVIDLVTKHKDNIDIFNKIPERLTAFIQDPNMAGGFNWRTPKSKSSSQRVKLQTKRSKRSVSSVNKKYKTQRNKKLFPFFKNKKNKK